MLPDDRQPGALATCTINKIPIKVAIINNSSLGMVRQWQTLYDGRHSFTDLNTGHDTVMIPTSSRWRTRTVRRHPGAQQGRRGCRDPSGETDRLISGDYRLHREPAFDGLADGAPGVGNSNVQYAKEHAPSGFMSRPQ
jgi:acetolactate synthase-1/2/3 large subunit